MTKIFNQSFHKDNRQKLRKNMPPAEVILWTYLKNRQIKGYKFRRQYSISNFIIDFYVPKVKLAVEIDGESHASEIAETYDTQRQKQIETLGVNFLRFTNWDVYENLEGVLEEISNHLPSDPL